MKSKMFIAAMTSIVLLASSSAFAQPGVGGPRPPMDDRRNPPGAPRPVNSGLRQIMPFTGQVGTWVNNDDFVYDGFYLQVNGKKMLVRFPGKMGTQLKNPAKTGSTITVNGVVEGMPSDVKTIRLVSLTANGQTLYDTASAPLPAPVAEQTVSGTGKISLLQKNAAGEVTGFILDNKTVLKVPPHVAAQLSQSASSGATIAYSGMKKSTAVGELTSGDYNIVHCQTITINGTQYLTR